MGPLNMVPGKNSAVGRRSMGMKHVIRTRRGVRPTKMINTTGSVLILHKPSLDVTEFSNLGNKMAVRGGRPRRAGGSIVSRDIMLLDGDHAKSTSRVDELNSLAALDDEVTTELCTKSRVDTVIRLEGEILMEASTNRARSRVGVHRLNS